MEGASQESMNASELKPSTDVFRPSSMGVKVILLDELLRSLYVNYPLSKIEILNFYNHPLKLKLYFLAEFCALYRKL